MTLKFLVINFKLILFDSFQEHFGNFRKTSRITDSLSSQILVPFETITTKKNVDKLSDTVVPISRENRKASVYFFSKFILQKNISACLLTFFSAQAKRLTKPIHAT